MTERTTWLRVARWMLLVGMLGLIVSAFLPVYAQVKGPSWIRPTPAGELMDIRFQDMWGKNADWVFVAAWAFPMLLLPIRLADFVVRTHSLRAVLGWVAGIACFGIFLAMCLVMWREYSRYLPFFFSWGGHSILFWSYFLATGSATLASLSACAAPVRARTSAVISIAGTWSVLYLIGMICMRYVTAAIFIPLCLNLCLALAASLLMATGAITETIILWRRGQAEGVAR